MKTLIYTILTLALCGCITQENAEAPDTQCLFVNDIKEPDMKEVVGAVGDVIFVKLVFDEGLPLPDNDMVTFYTTAGTFVDDTSSSSRIQVMVDEDVMYAQAQLVLKNAGERLFAYEYTFFNSKTTTERYLTVNKKQPEFALTDFTFAHDGTSPSAVGETITLTLVYNGDMDKINGQPVTFSTTAGKFTENPDNGMDDPVDTFETRFINGAASTQVLLGAESGDYYFRYEYDVDDILLLDQIPIEIQ